MLSVLAVLLLNLDPAVEVNALQAEVAAGRTPSALERMAKRIIAEPPLCAAARAGCQQVILAGLESRDEATQRNALIAFAAERGRVDATGVVLTHKAADAARHLGAYGYAGVLLVSVTQQIAESELDAHLLAAAQLFVRGGERARASTVFRYAEARFGPRASAEWAGIRQAVAVTPAARSFQVAGR